VEGGIQPSFPGAAEGFLGAGHDWNGSGAGFMKSSNAAFLSAFPALKPLWPPSTSHMRQGMYYSMRSVFVKTRREQTPGWSSPTTKGYFTAGRCGRGFAVSMPYRFTWI